MKHIIDHSENYQITCQINFVLEEEEEEERKEEFYSELDIPSDNEQLTIWWENFYRKAPYPFYGIILATTADQEIISLLQNHRDEIAEISGKECCFIYFRNIETAKK